MINHVRLSFYIITAFVGIYVNTACLADNPRDNFDLQINEHIDLLLRDYQAPLYEPPKISQGSNNGAQAQQLAFHELGNPEHEEKKLKSVLYEILHDYPQDVSLKIRRIIKKLRARDCPSNIKPKKLLMVGPSGVGKTTIAKGLAVLAQRPYILIRAPQLLTRFQFSGAENITNVIKSVLALHQPYVIIVDEINCLFDRFDNEHQPDKESGTALWLAIDECAARDDILFIGITNDAKKIPQQLKTRFANHMLEIPLPDVYVRKRIIRFYLKSVRSSLTNEMLNELAEKAHGLSARELEDMMTKAIERAYDRNPTTTKVRFSDIESALHEIRPYGRVITALKYVWDNKKEISKEAGPYITVAGFGLNVVQAILNEGNFLVQHGLNKLGYELGKDNYELSRSGNALQQQSHALGKRTFDFQKECHKESMVLQNKNYELQINASKMQQQGLLIQQDENSPVGKIRNSSVMGIPLSLFVDINQPERMQKNTKN